MVWNKLIGGSHALLSVANPYVNVFNAIATFVEPTPPTNIIKNDTILTQYNIKEGIKVYGKKFYAAVQKELQQFHDHRFVEPNKPQEPSIPDVPKT